MNKLCTGDIGLNIHLEGTLRQEKLVLQQYYEYTQTLNILTATDTAGE